MVSCYVPLSHSTLCSGKWLAIKAAAWLRWTPPRGCFVTVMKPNHQFNLFINICCCCSAYLSSCHRTASDAKLLDDPHTFHHQDYFVIGGIRTCLGVSDDPMFLWISSNSCPLNLLLVRSHQAEIIIKRLIQGRNNVTRVRVEPRSFDQGRRKNYAFTHSATLPTCI